MDQPEDLTIDILNEDSVRDLVTAICALLYERGIHEIHVGGLMRLIGVDEDLAADHDDELMILSDHEKFESTTGIDTGEQVPPGTTIH